MRSNTQWEEGGPGGMRWREVGLFIPRNVGYMTQLGGGREEESAGVDNVLSQV